MNLLDLSAVTSSEGQSPPDMASMKAEKYRDPFGERCDSRIC